MTPKKKAEQIIKKFIEPTKVPNIKMVWVEDRKAAIRCANIMIDEILKSYPTKVEHFNNSKGLNIVHIDNREYWRKVKLEVEQLELL